ncbi:aconitate hydratase [Rugosibacter aromaticivorans]|uniref:Aconitate hydratase n=1 Tax=Rugosibacter aromaticivorans TaxID=1565605 RepID=A0A0C5J1C2_9PROT|nr:aconitate hydratase AcnA [Rugosibacter aromaticivorans]AJP48922.1 aconitate hydratase [Rugosibacter aromaticivorans]
MHHNLFNSYQQFNSAAAEQSGFYNLSALEAAGLGRVSRLPVSIRIVLESVLRNCDGKKVTEAHVRQLAAWQPNAPRVDEIPFVVARILLQDFTGVPLLCDLAAMREVAQQLGHDPKRIEPLVPVDLVVDHSVQVDHYGSKDALRLNMQFEFERNHERYQFMKWGMQAFDTFKVVPPGIGIVHQVNLEYLFRGVQQRDGVCFPDTLVGTDSHTTMINGAGVVAWGVGGIEAEAGMLGQPVYFLTPDVVGVELQGKLPEGVTATDLVLTITEMLRKEKVVGKFIEFFGEGATHLSLTDRATLANMAPEYGATMGFFPVDDLTVAYLKGTGRSDAEVTRFENYFKAQGLFGIPKRGDIDYSSTLSLDLAGVVPALAGPKRPQDRIPLSQAKTAFAETFAKPAADNGFARNPADLAKRFKSQDGLDVGNGDVLIAAITSCTNTSNPSVMIAAGLLAKKAVESGLSVGPHVKTSLAPGSRVVTEYLTQSGLLPYLEQLGFNVAGYGCTTCIGNSGPLAAPIEDAVVKNDLIGAAVLSGNRNFEARIHPNIRANFLASPPLVVLYALLGTLQKDPLTEPIGYGKNGDAVWLRDLWPSSREIEACMQTAMNPATFRRLYADLTKDHVLWNAINSSRGQVYAWPTSTYIAKPPFFSDFGMSPVAPAVLRNARALAIFGDSVTTDHISPAGSISATSPAGQWLLDHRVASADFNSYGSRRGNHDVMVRGTFANVRIKNLMLPLKADGAREEGGLTLHQPSGEQVFIFDAAMRYMADGVPTVIFAGEEYGTGSSRDWAAKGTQLLGVKAVIARSFERIHRANLIGMGVLPLQFLGTDSAGALGIIGSEIFDLEGLDGDIQPQQEVTLVVHESNGTTRRIALRLRIDTPIEVDYYRHGGILPFVLRQLLSA